MRKVMLDEGDMQALEQKDVNGIACMIGKEGVQEVAGKFFCVMRNYRIAANVANAGWALVDAIDKGLSITEEYLRIKKALSIYAPEHFRPSRSELEYAVRTHEEMFNYLNKWNTSFETAVLIEKYFDQVEAMHAELNKLGG